jgi:hypothetical protein
MSQTISWQGTDYIEKRALPNNHSAAQQPFSDALSRTRTLSRAF